MLKEDTHPLSSITDTTEHIHHKDEAELRQHRNQKKPVIVADKVARLYKENTID